VPVLAERQRVEEVAHVPYRPVVGVEEEHLGERPVERRLRIQFPAVQDAAGDSLLQLVAHYFEWDDENTMPGSSGSISMDSQDRLSQILPSSTSQPSSVAGCIVGQAIGEMMGLPYENLSPQRIAKLARLDRPTFVLGYGCGFDDTEHAGVTAEAIRYANGDVVVFQRRLASPAVVPPR